MTRWELFKILDKEYNFDNQEDWDKCGGIFGLDYETEVTGVVIALDLTQLSIDKALETNANVIITHHPLFLENKDTHLPIKKNMELFKLMKDHDIVHITLHTCFDRQKLGTSYQIAKLITTGEIKYVDENPYFVYFQLDLEIAFKFFAQKLAKISNFSMVKYDETMQDKKIKTVGVVAGSGASFLEEVINMNDPKVDCFLTGDVKWHQYIEAKENDIVIVDIGHDAENIFVKTIKTFLENTNLKLYEMDLAVHLVDAKSV